MVHTFVALNKRFHLFVVTCKKTIPNNLKSSPTMKDTNHRNICRPTNTYRWYMHRTPRTNYQHLRAPTTSNPNYLLRLQWCTYRVWEHTPCLVLQGGAASSQSELRDILRHLGTFSQVLVQVWSVFWVNGVPVQHVYLPPTQAPTCEAWCHWAKPTTLWEDLFCIWIPPAKKKTETCIVVTKKCNNFISVILTYISIFWIQVCSQKRPLVEHTE